MAENIVLRNKAVKGRKSLYSRYVKEHLFSFGKQKDSFVKNENEKKVRPHANLNLISKIPDMEDITESTIKDASKENNNTIIKHNNNNTYTAARPPPIPRHRKPPSTATAFQSRTTNDLDFALKQFKLSTAASRESLKSSRLDLSEMEESVKTMIRSRPSTPVPERWRSRMMTL